MGPHLVPQRVYFTIFAALIVLTFITVVVAFVDLGPLNNFIAMSIAITKATLVIMYFMHVRYSDKLVWVFAGAGFLWLIILFVFLLSDYMTREAWSNLLTSLP